MTELERTARAQRHSHLVYDRILDQSEAWDNSPDANKFVGGLILPGMGWAFWGQVGNWSEVFMLKTHRENVKYEREKKSQITVLASFTLKFCCLDNKAHFSIVLSKYCQLISGRRFFTSVGKARWAVLSLKQPKSSSVIWRKIRVNFKVAL